MILFSAILNIKETLTKDVFISLVLEWNRNSPHKSNIIENIDWGGEHSFRFGDEKLFIAAQEYKAGDILALRYEKSDADGLIWDTDYIMNFKERRMAVRLERSIREDALKVSPVFSTPQFISYLIENRYLEEDGPLECLQTPLFINSENACTCADIISGRVQHRLPVVYVSLTPEGECPVNCFNLAYRLKGLAHVLIPENEHIQVLFKGLCKDELPQEGKISIYFPGISGKNKTFIYRASGGEDAELFDRITGYIIDLENSKLTGSEYTWQGVSNAILLEKLDAGLLQLKNEETKRLMAEAQKSEAEELVDAVDEELSDLQSRIEALTKENSRLQFENQSLHAARVSSGRTKPLLSYGEEEDLFDGEIKAIILSVLEGVLSNTEPQSRRAHVLSDIINGNGGYNKSIEEREKQLKEMLRSYRTITAALRKQLTDMGFEITEDGKHYKLTYFNDPRYWTSVSKTSSDNRAGMNIAGTIIRTMF